MRGFTLSVIGICLVTINTGHASSADVSTRLHGHVEGRFVFSDNQLSVFDGGFGKLRYGADATGDGQQQLEFGEAAVDVFSQWNSSLSSVVSARVAGDTDAEFDIIEAFLRWRPVSTTRWRYSVKVGAFFPQLSFENEGVAWSNTFMLTNSAANTWFAEEFRPVGAEIKAEWRGDITTVEFTGSAYFANDRSGVALTLRGFTLNDARNGLFGGVRIADLPPGRVDETNHPFVESDGRPGFALGVNVKNQLWGDFFLYLTDNRGDVTEVGSEGRLWDTRFINAHYSREFGDRFFAGAQLLWGDTVTAPTGDRSDVLGTEFFSLSGLVSAEFDNVMLSIRPEYFDQRDLTTLAAPPSFDESGFALTTSASYFLGNNQQITAEYVYADSDREAGASARPDQIRESQFMLNYRLSF